ncbi:hypothetical protein [Propionibacterium freudenreichii]|uniref:hypothetical protein n=1 Tax=Propionibacterium freudenreichii TaxID=1744 RepID=UPI00155D8CE6|nr:hypothetical protein [Propionibacterium freudenreichii]
MKATQYAKSTDPEVIATIEENELSRRAWIDDTKAWFGKTIRTGIPGAKLFLFSTRTAIRLLGIVTSDEKKPAGWKFCWRSRSRFEHERTIPCAPHGTHAGGKQRRSQVCRGSHVLRVGRVTELVEDVSLPFISSGAAWLDLEHMPDPDSPHFGPQWTEVRASQAMAAKEALKDAS